MFPPNPPRARPWRRATTWLTGLAALFLALSAGGLQAQQLRGRITGPNGEPVAAALVHAASASDTSQSWTRSGEDGRYALRLPPGGPWIVSVQRIGFAPYRATVERADAAHDVTLAARATLLDRVEVRGSPAAIRNTPGGPGGQASSRPASTLEWTTTTPGDLGEAALLAEGTVPVDAGGSGVPGVSIAGQAPGANRVTADGASWGGASLPAEGVKSVGVVAETYDVARGQFTGGHIAATTHSGTRDPGGAMRFRFAGNPGDWLEDAQTSSPDGVLGLFSGAYGGPVGGRLFGFTAVQASVHEWDVRPLTGNPEGTLRGRGLDPDSVRRMDNLLRSAGLSAAGEEQERGYNVGGLARLDWKRFTAHDVGVRLDYRRSRRPLPPSPMNLTAPGGWSRGEDAGVLGTVVSRIRTTTNELRVYGARGTSSTRPDEELPSGLVGVGGDGEGIAGLSFGGGQQMSTSSRRSLFEANDVFRWTFGGGAQRLQLGGTLGVERTTLESGPEAFGTFYFQDLQALEDARPALFTRRLTGRDAAAESRYGAVFAGHTWQASPDLGITWGVRLEHLGYGGRADYDPAVAAAFPGLERGIPSSLVASPRVGFHYAIPRATGTSWITLRGGIGRFVGRVPLEGLALSAGETGVEDRTLVCVGDAAPAADWAALRDPANAPRTCADGAAGSGDVRTATAFAPDFTAPRQWRASLSGDWQPIARFRVALGGTVLRGDGLATARDLNLPDAPAFTLDAEAGRGVYAPAGMIDPGTGLVPPLAGRPHAGLGTVRRIGGEARSGTTQL
ncbi:carboxypeptidase-like regulatory domain-containing protein, partial [Longimicrobium sp.]|uniref:TonB-dependent receptor n=1 Tax=Longimicrobium sp. TaxID=2029185 RepID=UPI002E36778E